MLENGSITGADCVWKHSVRSISNWVVARKLDCRRRRLLLATQTRHRDSPSAKLFLLGTTQVQYTEAVYLLYRFLAVRMFRPFPYSREFLSNLRSGKTRVAKRSNPFLCASLCTLRRLKVGTLFFTFTSSAKVGQPTRRFYD